MTDDEDESPPPDDVAEPVVQPGVSGREILEWLGIIAFMAAACVWHWWPTPHTRTTQECLDFWTTAVRRSYCSIADKERLLDRIEIIEDRVQAGEKMTHTRWQRHDAVIRDLLRRGITPDTLPLIERQLQRVENDFAMEEDQPR